MFGPGSWLRVFLLGPGLSSLMDSHLLRAGKSRPFHHRGDPGAPPRGAVQTVTSGPTNGGPTRPALLPSSHTHPLLATLCPSLGTSCPPGQGRPLENCHSFLHGRTLPAWSHSCRRDVGSCLAGKGIPLPQPIRAPCHPSLHTAEMSPFHSQPGVLCSPHFSDEGRAAQSWA